jgi:hypothetical protein
VREKKDENKKTLNYYFGKKKSIKKVLRKGMGFPKWCWDLLLLLDELELDQPCIIIITNSPPQGGCMLCFFVLGGGSQDVKI